MRPIGRSPASMHYIQPRLRKKAIVPLCNREIPIIEDAAEAMGSFYKNNPCGSFGDLAVFSFNGNKIITTSAGGALVCKNEIQHKKAVFWATQSKETEDFYLHKEAKEL